MASSFFFHNVAINFAVPSSTWTTLWNMVFFSRNFCTWSEHSPTSSVIPLIHTLLTEASRAISTLNFDVIDNWKSFHSRLLVTWVFSGVRWILFSMMESCKIASASFAFLTSTPTTWTSFELLPWSRSTTAWIDFFLNSSCMNVETRCCLKTSMMPVGCSVVRSITFEINVTTSSLTSWMFFLGPLKHSFSPTLSTLILKWRYLSASSLHRPDISSKVSLDFV